MHDVFISYSTKDLVPAEKVRDILERNRIPCWMAPRDIPVGSNYAKEIPQAIRICQVFLLILSENAQSSNWVVKELDNAVNCGKIIIPLMLEDCPLNDEFNFLLTGAQRYTSYRKSEETLKTLIKQIQAVTGIKQDPAEETAPERVDTESAVPEIPVKETIAPQTGSGPVVKEAKPVKIRRKKEKTPVVLGKVKALAALSIPVMAVLPLLGFLLGHLHYFRWKRTMFFPPDYKILAFYAITGLMIGAAMWWEWISFRNREERENPRKRACPSCGSFRLYISNFRTHWMTGKERWTLLLIPVCAVLGSASQLALMALSGRLLHIYNLTALQQQSMYGAGLVQGLAVGCWAANLLVRHLRRRAGLRSTVCRCSHCQSTFLSVSQES